MHHMGRDFFRFSEFAAEQDIGLPVGGCAFGKKGADALEGIFHAQQRAMRLVADAFHDAFRRAPETDDESMFAQADEVFGICDQAAAGGDD
jgi:hypothetical protein